MGIPKIFISWTFNTIKQFYFTYQFNLFFGLFLQNETTEKAKTVSMDNTMSCFHHLLTAVQVTTHPIWGQDYSYLYLYVPIIVPE